MKRLSKKLISIILITAMIFSSTITNFAIDDLTLGENNFVETFSTEGENNSFVATDSDLDSLNNNADEEEKLDDEDQDSTNAATSSEIDNEVEKSENDDDTKIKIKDENDELSTPSNANEEPSNDSLDENSIATISDLEEDKDIVATISQLNENIIATISEFEHNNTFATISEIEITVSTKSNIKIASNSNIFEDKATNSEIKNYKTGYRKENLVVSIPEKSESILFGSSPIPKSFDSRVLKNPANNAMSIIPPLKNQGQHGTCWAFATMGLIETSLRKQGLVTSEEECDLSELALAYYTYNLKNITNNSTYLDTPGLEGNDYVAILVPKANFDNFGGNVLSASLMTSTFMGILRESKDESLEYKPLDSPFNTPLDKKYAFNNNDYIIKNALFLNKNDRESVKQAIIDYGAVSISFYGDGDGYNAQFSDNVVNGEHYIFPYANAGTANHAIIVVGWDDDVPASYFKNTKHNVTATNPGAWICKNSWGDYEFGNNGFFYLSYDEQSIGENVFAIEATKADTYKYNYHYDTTDSTCAIGVTLKGFSFAFSNIYKVHSDETLDAVSVALYSTNAVFDILIYTKDSIMNNPSDGTLALTQSNISTTYPGIYTIDLDTKVNLSKDTYYSIIIKTKSADDNSFIVMVDSNEVTIDGSQTVNAASLGQSFKGNYLGTSFNWFDMNDGNTSGLGENLRIRGLTNPVNTTHKYTVNYNLGGVSATAPTPITKTYGEALAANTLKNPTNIPTGYTFAGWYKESTYVNEWIGDDDLTNGTTAQTIYARWKAKITYNQNGHGTAPAAVDVYLNNTTTLPSINNVTGYTFDTTNSWYDDSNIATATLIGSAGSDYTVTEPKTLYARWNENEYTITYHNVDASDGVNWSTEFTLKTNRKYSEAVTLPVAANLSKNDGTNDYIFKGWWTLDGTTSNNWGTQVTQISANTVAPTGGHVFYARWNPAWKISFNMLGHGTAPNYITAEQGTKVPSTLIPATPTATGFIFKGWFKTYDASAATFDAKYSNEWNFSTMNVTENMVLFAKWQPITYTIKYNANGGTISKNTDTKTYDANLTLVTPTKTGHDFEGWYTDNDTFVNSYDGTTNLSTTNNDTKDIYAKWTAHTYNISFNIGTVGATAPSPVSKTYGIARNAALPNPTNIPAGYEFLGWYKEATYNTAWTGLIADDDLTSDDSVTIPVYAKWKRAIIFNVLHNGVDIGATAPPSQEITGATNITLPSTSATGYTFGGWYKESTLTNFVGMDGLSVPVDAPTTFYAKWTPKTYTINYNAKGGTITGDTSFTKTYGTAITTDLATPAKAGYTFNGWFTDDNTFNTPYNKANDAIYVEGTTTYTIFAKWTAKTYTINYNPKGGTIAGDTSFTKTYGTAITTNLVTPTRVGYTFNGWFTDDNTFNTPYNKATDAIYVEGTTTYTIFAKWTPKTYTINYNAKDGTITGDTSFTKTYGTAITTDLITPIKIGYTFNGWFTDDNTFNTAYNKASDAIYVEGTSTYTIFAKWTENTYNIIYHNDNLSGVTYATNYTKPTSRKYTQEITLPNSNQISRKDGSREYKFDGWWTADGSTSNNWGTKVEKIAANNTDTTAVHEFYAKWIPIWNVSFNMSGYGGTAPATQQIIDKGKATKPTNKPTAEGKKFLGWYDSNLDTANEFNFNSEITSDIVIYAKWQDAVTIKFNFNMNGHGAQTNSKFVAEGESLDKPTDPKADGYTFKYWYETDENTAFDFTTIIQASSESIRTLTAKWTENSYRITLNTNEGAYINNFTAKTSRKYTEAYTLPTANNIEKSGFTFVGWFDNEKLEGTAITNIPAKTIGDKTYWLKWEAIKQKTNNNSNNSSRSSSSSNSSGSGGSGGSSGRSMAALQNTQQQPNQTQTQTGPGNMPSTKLSIDTNSVNCFSATENSTWNKDSSGNWHISITNALGQSVEVKNAWCSVKSVKMVDNVPITVDDYYFMGSDGTMLTGWLTDANNKTYYLGTESWNIGRMARGWEKIGDKYYYFNTDGLLVTNSVTPDGYKLDATGAWIV